MKRYMAVGLAALITACSAQQESPDKPAQTAQETPDERYEEYRLADLDHMYLVDNGKVRRTADLVPIDYDGDGDVDHVGFNQDNQILLYENLGVTNEDSWSNAPRDVSARRAFTIRQPNALDTANDRYVPSIDVFRNADGMPIIQFVDQANDVYHVR